MVSMGVEREGGVYFILSKRRASKCSRRKRFCNCLSACYFGKKQYLCSV